VRAQRGEPAVVAAGQQAGLLGGPLLALTKAVSAARLAGEIAGAGEPCRGLFWIASEDHDLNEIAQATILRNGAPETFRLPVPPKNFQPAGSVLVPPEINELFSRIEEASEGPPEIVGRFARAWSPGRPYAQAFRETLEPLLAEEPLDWVDPMDDRWKAKELEFFRRAFARAKEIVGALDGADRSLRQAGYEPQVGRAERDFPAFVIEGQVRSKISWDGAKFSVHGRGESFSAEALADFVSRPGNRPSAAALLRPVLQSHLFPVAASVLGPSELSYHAQTAPLFDVLDLPRPVFLPRPHLIPRGARERRALEALGLEDADTFRARDAAKAAPPPVSPKLAALEAEIAGRLAALVPEIEGIDPTLAPVASGTGEKAAHAIARLREKVERAAERKDGERVRRFETIENLLAPGGVPADRVYGPLTYLMRFGEAFVAELSRKAECRTDGARFVDFE
jgi:bacillithiol biosynthesis cysteine-adding enzyme BshC